VTTFIQSVKDMRDAQIALEKNKTKENLAKCFAMEKRIDKLLEATKMGGQKVKNYDERYNQH